MQNSNCQGFALCALWLYWRCAGEGELMLRLTGHGPMLQNADRDVKRQVLPACSAIAQAVALIEGNGDSSDLARPSEDRATDGRIQAECFASDG
jgi:hypothetical protein